VDGVLRGVEAVIDKDLAGQLLARHIGATILAIATDIDHVMIGYGTASQRPLGRTTPGELRAYAAAGHFAGGSMGPKVEAAVRFVEAGGRRAVITSLEHIADGAGTIVEKE
jgi:carbamate kinase